jgi:hypothetical protein
MFTKFSNSPSLRLLGTAYLAQLGSEKMLKCRPAENVSFDCVINLRGEIFYKISDTPRLAGAPLAGARLAHSACPRLG